MKERRFLICRTCGNIISMVSDSGVTPECCGDAMEELVPGTTDGAMEKHVPVIRKEIGRVIVSVGELPHPMTAEHSIQWIVLETDKGRHFRKLALTDKPEAEFCIFHEKPVKAYAYCNLHGLWEGTFDGKDGNEEDEAPHSCGIC